MQKFSISLPDGTVSDIDAAAVAAGIRRAEWIRRACVRMIAAGGLDGNTAENPENPGTLAGTIGTLERTRDELAQVTAAADQLRRDLDARDQVLAARVDEIAWLRGQVALVNEQKALTEKSGEGKRPWWKFW